MQAVLIMSFLTSFESCVAWMWLRHKFHCSVSRSVNEWDHCSIWDRMIGPFMQLSAVYADKSLSNDDFCLVLAYVGFNLSPVCWDNIFIMYWIPSELFYVLSAHIFSTMFRMSVIRFYLRNSDDLLGSDILTVFQISRLAYLMVACSAEKASPTPQDFIVLKHTLSVKPNLTRPMRSKVIAEPSNLIGEMIEIFNRRADDKTAE